MSVVTTGHNGRSKVEEQIKELLGQGLSNTVVASAVGCSPGLITQLLSDETFSQEVTTLRAASLTAATKRDRSIDTIEDKLIARLHSIADYIHKPMEIVAALSAVNKMVRRGNPAQQGHVINQTVVNLNLPSRSLQEYVKSAQGEVIEVAGQSLVTMPAAQLLNKLKQTAQEEGNVQNRDRYDKISRTLPGSKILIGSAVGTGIPRALSGGQSSVSSED